MKEQKSSDTFTLATRYVNRGGLSIIPILSDGSKRPAGEWKDRQRSRPSTDQLIEAFGSNGVGLAIVCGPVSGGLEVLDFDDDAEGIFFKWARSIEEAGTGELLCNLPIVRTPSDGFHVYFRSNSPQGNNKLARRKNAAGRIQELIETRGSGGYVLAPGSPAECHKSGNTYRIIQGDLCAIPKLTADQRELLILKARELNEYWETREDPRPAKNNKPGVVSPWEDFDQQGDFSFLQTVGWKHLGNRGADRREQWRAPGAHCNPVSAEVSDYKNLRRLKVWSSSAAPFEEGHAYTTSQALALTVHDGDFAASVKELRAKGFGSPNQTPPKAPPIVPTVPMAAPVLWDIGHVTDWPEEPLEWDIENIIPKGTIGFLGGAPKDGKSLLIADLLVHWAHKLPWLEKFECSAPRVLYICREDPRRRLKHRLIEINASYGYPPIPQKRIFALIRDRFSFVQQKWLDWLQLTIEQLQTDMVIFDVLGRMIGDLDSRDGTDMAHLVDILEPFNRDLHQTLLLVDHTRKPTGPDSARTGREPNPFDLIGSVSKYGSAEFMMMLGRTEQAGRLQLYTENKDTDDNPHFLIDRSRRGSGLPKFKYAGNVATLSQDRKELGDKNRKNVQAALVPSGIKVEAICQVVGLKESAVQNHLKALKAEGLAVLVGKGKNSQWFPSKESPTNHHGRMGEATLQPEGDDDVF